jgi:predicted lipoprotein with Yx(FWY)xxD motif
MRKQLSLMFIFIFLITASMWSCATTPTVQLKDKVGSGKYLTDENGMTLYYHKRDFIEQSSCIDTCIGRWPIFYSRRISAPPGVNEKDFGKILRIDAEPQTTFRGYPLYYFSGDTQPGDMKGEGIDENWFVVYPDKFKP